MKKKMLVGILSTALAMSMSMTAFAGQWQSDTNGWWWQNDNGSYPANTWQWIDGNNDGTAESYYFNEQGYCLMNTTTPDGYTVNPAGAWVVDGVVQTQAINTIVQNPAVPALNLLDTTPTTKSSYAGKFTNYRTAQGALWSEGYYLYSYNCYLEFYAGKQYQTFTATLGVKQSTNSPTMTVEIYGDNDVLLVSFSLDKHTEPFEISVDISGQNYIKIVNAQDDIMGYAMFKNAQFK